MFVALLAHIHDGVAILTRSHFQRALMLVG
jgi:hypothetical protein